MPSSNSILSEFEWDEGMTIPVANAENKILEEEILKKQKDITSLQKELSENEDRVHAMTSHLKNVRQELQHTQALVDARRKEIETEQHLQKVAEREEGRLKQEILRLEMDYEELKEKKNIYENNIFRQTQKLEEMKSRMNWDQQALEAWLEESARKDEDAMTLQKYSRQDEAKIKELSLRIEHLTEDSQKKKRTLDHEMTETLTAQIELDKTAEEFRNAHADRQELISQWEQTIDQMQRRDKEMDLLASQLARVKAEVRQREEIIKEKQQFLDNEIENNKELEMKISLAERTSAKMRLDFQEAEQQRDQFQSEASPYLLLDKLLEALKRTVDRTAMDLETTRAEVTQMKKEVAEKQDKLSQAKQLHEALNEKLKQVSESALSAEEQASRMDELLQQEEVHQKELDVELKRLRELHFRKTQELYQARTEERNTEAEIQGSRAAIRNLNSKINKLDHDSLKQQEIVYNQDFAIQQLERRINRMQGEQSNEEKLQLEAKIKELTEELEQKSHTRHMLSLQLKRLQDDVRRVKRDLEKSTSEKDSLTSKIEELDLHNDSSQRELANVINIKQELMVEENLMKLQLKRIRDRLNDKADQVYDLEHRKLQLETAMKERRHEIDIHTEMLTAQLKAGNEEKSQISLELHERIAKIDKLRKRYEILMVSMAPPEGEEEHSQAYYVIKAAQDKEELQREGDELDAKIRKAEKEMRALENTLRLMNGRNETYRKSFNKVTETSDEMEDKEQLEEQLRAVMDKYKYKRRQIRELQEDLQTMSNTLENLSRDEDAYVELIEEKQNKIIQLTKEGEEQQTKLDRVAKQNIKQARELRTSQKLKGETPEERDFEVRELREMNRQGLKMVGEVGQQYPEVMQAVHLYFTQAGLPVPPAPGTAGSLSSSRLSSRQSSTRSSVISARSSLSSTQKVAAVQIGEELGSPGSSSSRSSVASWSSRGSRR
ncbi:hypothetical protein LSH36_772g01071 [Paralvinella palmiformis]|uniref:Coiled-coil domain-containing protein 39 n=1 Tax=Paralvinella palmiformis TaxID=53620 RepID=A0AAD9J1C2_9ANNE|nr:hypothetical protein LSH36_772g01071 [Paralvinella palmiformis]